MKFRLFYGGKPTFTRKDAAAFSHGDYACRTLLQKKDGAPVGIFYNKRDDIWKVQHGFSQVFFGTYAEALAYCKGRFADLDGEKV